MEQAQRNSLGSRQGLAALAKEHRGHPLLRSLEAYLESEQAKYHRDMVKTSDPVELYRMQGRLLQLQALDVAIKEPK
uniref:Uncharacterized protein n=1 Tax=viral metagenome TaxID=1070528 RepID=A0A6M3X5R6_9ZZZZ